MKKLVAVLLVMGSVVLTGGEAMAEATKAKSVYDFKVKDIDGEEVSLSRYKGDVLLIVNVASQCGLTASNYKGLEELYKKYKAPGLKVLAFPANNFGSQEPGSNDEIKDFCRNTKSATFDLFAKVSVKGDDKCPLYEYLTKHQDKDVAGEVKWNFQKYLVNRKGEVVAKFEPMTSPTDKELVTKVEGLLAEKAE